MRFDLSLPGVLAVVEEPLIAQSNDTLFTSAGHNLLLGLIVRHSEALVNHLLADDGLGILDTLSSADADLHYTMVEASLIALVLGLIELDGVLVGLDLHLLYNSLGAQVTKALDIDKRERVEALNPLKLNTHALTQTLLSLQISQHGEIVRCIRWHRCDDSSTFSHADGRERQDVDVLVRGHGCLDLHTNQLSTSDLSKSGVLKVNLGHLLMGKVPSSTLSDDEKIIVLHLIDAVLALRQDKAVGLTVHGLRTESTSDQEDVTIAELLQASREVEHADLDASVLLGSNTFTSATVMIGTWLTLRLGEDSVALAELDLVVVLQVVELPANELIIVRVLGSGDEVPSPVSVQAQTQQVGLTERWEEVKPVVGVGEARNLIFRDSELHQDFVLRQRRPLLVLGCRLFLFRSWLVAASGTAVDLTLQADGSRGDRHAGAVEGEWE